MNICFGLVDMDPVNGILKVVKNIANKLTQDSNYSVSVLSYIDSEGWEECNFDEKIKIYTLGIPVDKKNAFRYFRMIPKLNHFFKENKVDCFIVSGMEYMSSVFLSGAMLKTKIIAWEHSNFFKGPFLRLEWFGKRVALRYFDAILTITKRDFQEYQNHHPKCALYQIYNLLEWKEREAQYNLQSRKIVSCGFLMPVKGFDMLIDAAALFLKKYPEWIWDIYSRGPEKENLQKQIESYGLQNQIFLKGYCNNLNQKYREYSFFVLTSRKEGMGMVIAEAQKAGLPVVSFDIPCGPSDLIEDQVNGELVPPFDLKNLAERIENLMTDPNKRIFYSDNSTIKHNELDAAFVEKKWKQMLSSVVKG